MINRIPSRLIFILLTGVLLVSCAPTKQASFFRTYSEDDKINNPDRTYFIEKEFSENIQPGDQLFITVSSGNDDPNSFNQATGQPISDIDLLSYEVDREGFIKIPYLNRIKVSGFSPKQLIDTLESQLTQYIYLPSVKVNYASSRVTVLGEVNRPGIYTFNRKSISIFQAIANAGDIASFGNRRNVAIIRHEGNTILKKRVDLTNDQILTSSWYNIRPNDIIYVEPLNRKKWGMETFDYGLIFSAISTFLLIITYNSTRQ